METVDIKTLMQQSAQDAIDIFGSQLSQKLDFTFESLDLVDAYLEHLSSQELSDQDLYTLSYVFGAYLGELYISKFGGDWLYIEETENEPPQTFVTNNERTYAFPSKVYHRLQATDEEPFASYFDKIAEEQASNT